MIKKRVLSRLPCYSLGLCMELRQHRDLSQGLREGPDLWLVETGVKPGQGGLCSKRSFSTNGVVQLGPINALAGLLQIQKIPIPFDNAGWRSLAGSATNYMY